VNDRRYLFEKLAGMRADSFDVARAVAAQIERLMRTLPVDEPDDALAAAPHLLNLGLPAVVDLGNASPAKRAFYGEHLRAQILHFEPRLANPRVVFGEAPIGVEIRADIVDGVSGRGGLCMRVDREGLQQLA
jgi:predicted component of type VI protein secretion system